MSSPELRTLYGTVTLPTADTSANPWQVGPTINVFKGGNEDMVAKIDAGITPISLIDLDQFVLENQSLFRYQNYRIDLITDQGIVRVNNMGRVSVKRGEKFVDVATIMLDTKVVLQRQLTLDLHNIRLKHGEILPPELYSTLRAIEISNPQN